MHGNILGKSMKRPATNRPDYNIVLFESMFDWDCFLFLAGVRKIERLAKFIVAFAELCGGVRTSGTEFVAYIEVPGTVEIIDELRDKIAEVIHSHGDIELISYDLKREVGSKGRRLTGKLELRVI